MKSALKEPIIQRRQRAKIPNKLHLLQISSLPRAMTLGGVNKCYTDPVSRKALALSSSERQLAKEMSYVPETNRSFIQKNPHPFSLYSAPIVVLHASAAQSYQVHYRNNRPPHDSRRTVQITNLHTGLSAKWTTLPPTRSSSRFLSTVCCLSVPRSPANVAISIETPVDS